MCISLKKRSSSGREPVRDVWNCEAGKEDPLGSQAPHPAPSDEAGLQSCTQQDHTVDDVTADAPGRVWAVDFHFDVTTDGPSPIGRKRTGSTR
jgi:hypothetical protein